MRTAAVLALVFATALCGQKMPVAEQQALVAQYCSGCHSEKLRSGGFSWTTVDLAHPEKNAEQAEKVIRKVGAGMMPPPGMPRPSMGTMRNFTRSLESAIDAAAANNPNPGRPALRRLNRTEFANSVRELLGIEIDATKMLPPEDTSRGFDNLADAQTISATLMQSHVAAAGRIARLAVGDATMSPVTETYHVPSTFTQSGHIEGTPAGARGGAVFRHTFPADGDYAFEVSFFMTDQGVLWGTTLGKGEQLEIAIDGRRVALVDIDPNISNNNEIVRVPAVRVLAGPHDVAASFLPRARGPVDDLIEPNERAIADSSAGLTIGLTTRPHLRNLSIAGPYKPTGVADTPSRKRIFICHPANEAEEIPCARRIVTNLAQQAFRRPVKDTDVDELMEFFKSGREKADFDSGIRTALQLILAHPEFIFRFEYPPAGLKPETNYRISDLELASRLSFFLWSAAPDAELVRIASENRLHDPVVLEQQFRRMMGDARSEALARNFGGQWLRLQNLKDILPDVNIFPNFDENLARSMRRETELFFDSIIREDLPVTDLINANYTFVDGRLARHYRIPNVDGDRFRRVTLTDPNRFGLLGQGSILTLTSYANRTSPVARGKWVLDVLLGVPPPPPPPNVPLLKENAPGTRELSVRERQEEHRTNEPCRSCHQIMDGIGFALDNFDATGAWRIHDGAFDVDARSELYDGTKVNGPRELRAALEQHSDAFVRNFTQNLMMYALGRGLDYQDMPVVRDVERKAAAKGNRFSAFLLGILQSAPFQMRRS
jgi:hypothetical protein